MFKKLSLVLLLTILVSGNISFAEHFSDVSDDITSINWLYENDVINGYSDGTFRPDNSVNRAEFLKMLFSIIITDEEIETYKNTLSPEGRFSDISGDEWYAQFTTLGHYYNFVDGYPDGTFKADNTINFAEAFKITQRAFFDFWDPTDSWQYWNVYDPCYKALGASNWDQWYWRYLHYLDNYCIISEKIANYGNEFDASKAVSREDAAELLYRAKTVRDNSKYVDFSTTFYKYSTDMIPGEAGYFKETANKPIVITSPAFYNLDTLAEKYTCDGENINPPLKYEGIHEDTKSLALIMLDEYDTETWNHWVLWNISPDITEIAENSIPEGAIEGVNSWGETGYGGPCPPEGIHKYYFKVYVLDIELDISSESTADDLLDAMSGHILDYFWISAKYPHE